MKSFSTVLICFTAAASAAVASAFVVKDRPISRRITSSQRPMAAPGIEVAPVEALKEALSNPDTVVLDIRSVPEIAEMGYWETPARWLHAPGSPMDNPILSVAAEAMIPDKSTPIIVYCAAGPRSAKAKQVLEDQGYETVLNAGGYPGDIAAAGLL